MTTLPASEETVVPALSAGLIAELKLEAEGRLPRGTVPILASQLLALIEMVNSAREQAVRECAEIVWNLPANTGEYVRRHDADAAIKSLLPKPRSLSQVSAKK